ncbi:hypothetical protein BJV78DRAFT_1361570 [Lactifluus subvellereus]|nr:hypothetical protein BJV78DRAFT_1361570 [Lactifluus subvellereus]
MFNAPRPTQAYGISSSMARSLECRSNALPASSPSIFTNAIESDSALGRALFSHYIYIHTSKPPLAAEATIPAIYQQSFGTVDPTNSGETSVNSLSRVLSTSSLPAATVDKIVNLVSTRPRVSKLEFFVALALVALAQAGKDVSVEQVALLAQQNTLPEPTLDISLLSYSATPVPTTAASASHPSLPYGQPASSSSRSASASAGGGGGSPSALRNAVAADDDPWMTGRFGGAGLGAAGGEGGGVNGGAPSSVAGTGLPSGWWKRQEKVSVQFGGQQGFVLNRYIVYGITAERGGTVQRRYSEFAFLRDCLVHRYPFRLLPQLPPKRIGPDESFLEQRRKGLERFLRFVMNHPVIKEDALLGTFLTEPSFEQWRKHSSISMEEESASKRIDRVEEMTIPATWKTNSGTFDKGLSLSSRLGKKSREAAVVRGTSTVTRPSLIPHLRLPSALRVSSTPSLSYSDDANPVRLPSVFSPFSSRDPALSLSPPSTAQADLSRLTNTLKTLVEVNGQCWKGEGCDLTEGVNQGINVVSSHTQRHNDLLELRTGVLLQDTLEGLKSQRDLYIAMRDLFIRHDRLSVDQVERLKKRVDTNALKLESVKAVKKDGWEDEADKVAGNIEKDKATISAQLNRRVFIRACMWHELRVVLHNRENTLLTQVIQSFAREERDYAQSVAANWASLAQAVESMPFE